MTGWELAADRCEQYLLALHHELAGRGVRCGLDDRGLWPRLRIYYPVESATAEFDNNVVAAPINGRWCFCWPSAVPIGPVSSLAQVADDICAELGLEGDPDGGGAGEAVVSLSVGWMLRQARRAVASPHRRSTN